MRKNSDLTALISRLIGDWIQRYLPVHKIRSDKTIEAYEYALALFLEFLESEKVIDGLKIVPDNFCKDNIPSQRYVIFDLNNFSRYWSSISLI